LAETETLIAQSAMIAKTSGNERRDINILSPLFKVLDSGRRGVTIEPEEQQVPWPHKLSASFRKLRCPAGRAGYENSHLPPSAQHPLDYKVSTLTLRETRVKK
jgi:hypothetical protein